MLFLLLLLLSSVTLSQILIPPSRGSHYFPANIYLIKVKTENTRKRSKICSKLTIKTPEQRHWDPSIAFIFNFEHIYVCWITHEYSAITFYIIIQTLTGPSLHLIVNVDFAREMKWLLPGKHGLMMQKIQGRTMTEVYSEVRQTSKTELFAKIGTIFQLYTIFSKRSISDVSRNGPLSNTVYYLGVPIKRLTVIILIAITLKGMWEKQFWKLSLRRKLSQPISFCGI